MLNALKLPEVCGDTDERATCPYRSPIKTLSTRDPDGPWAEMVLETLGADFPDAAGPDGLRKAAKADGVFPADLSVVADKLGGELPTSPYDGNSKGFS